MAWTSPATVATGDILTAAWGNTYIRDNLLALAGSTGKVDASSTVKGLQSEAVLYQILGL